MGNRPDRISVFSSSCSVTHHWSFAWPVSRSTRISAATLAASPRTRAGRVTASRARSAAVSPSPASALRVHSVWSIASGMSTGLVMEISSASHGCSR